MNSITLSTGLLIDLDTVTTASMVNELCAAVRGINNCRNQVRWNEKDLKEAKTDMEREWLKGQIKTYKDRMNDCIDDAKKIALFIQISDIK